jgi:hypothetical protein
MLNGKREWTLGSLRWQWQLQLVDDAPFSLVRDGTAARHGMHVVGNHASVIIATWLVRRGFLLVSCGC